MEDNEAFDIVERMRQAYVCSGADGDLLRKAMETLKKVVVTYKPPRKPRKKASDK